MLDLNPAGVRLFGFASREVALAASAYDLYWEPSGRERFAALMREQGFVEELESDLRTVDGDRPPGARDRLRGARWRGPGGRLPGHAARRDGAARARRAAGARRRRWRRSGGWPAGWPTTSTTLLTAINGYKASCSLRRLPAGDPFCRREVEEIHRAGRRAAELTGQLLTLLAAARCTRRAAST